MQNFLHKKLKKNPYLILKLVISIEKLHKTQLEFKQLYVHSIYTQNLNTQTVETFITILYTQILHDFIFI